MGLARTPRFTPRFIAPGGCGALSSPPEDAERANSGFVCPGRPEWPFSPGPLIVLCNERGESRWFESRDSGCDRSARRRRVGITTAPIHDISCRNHNKNIPCGL